MKLPKGFGSNIRPGDIIKYKGGTYRVKGTNNPGGKNPKISIETYDGSLIKINAGSKIRILPGKGINRDGDSRNKQGK